MTRFLSPTVLAPIMVVYAALTLALLISLANHTTDSSISTLLAATIACVALFSTLSLLHSPTVHPLSRRLVGSMWACAMCFAADNSAVYTVGLFIVATLVTELEFLEKLAAIVWGREAYWKYKLQKASPAQVANEQQEDAVALASEVGQDSPTTKAADSIASLQDEVRGFEAESLRALESGETPLPGLVRKHVAIHGPNVHNLCDAVIETADAHFVVEVKYLRSVARLQDATAQVLHIAAAYQAARIQGGSALRVIPLLLVPAHIEAPLVYRDVPVLSFDRASHRFTNAREIRKVIAIKLGIQEKEGPQDDHQQSESPS